MKHLMRPLSLSLILGIVAMATNIFSTPSMWAQASLPVRVTNTPLPVQGSVNAIITNPSVPVSGTVNVSSLPAVQLSGTPTVTVGNAETSPVLIRDVDHPANEPFSAATCSENNSGGLPQPCLPDLHRSFVVPTTVSGKTVKRLVIEYISGHCEGTPGTYLLDLRVGVDVSLASGRIHHLVPVLLPNVNGAGNVYAVAQQTRIYVDPGKDVDVGWGAIRSAAGDNALVCNVQIDGSLVTQ
jgi:hypothetical protein